MRKPYVYVALTLLLAGCKLFEPVPAIHVVPISFQAATLAIKHPRVPQMPCPSAVPILLHELVDTARVNVQFNDHFRITDSIERNRRCSWDSIIEVKLHHNCTRLDSMKSEIRLMRQQVAEIKRKQATQVTEDKATERAITLVLVELPTRAYLIVLGIYLAVIAWRWIRSRKNKTADQ